MKRAFRPFAAVLLLWLTASALAQPSAPSPAANPAARARTTRQHRQRSDDCGASRRRKHLSACLSGAWTARSDRLSFPDSRRRRTERHRTGTGSTCSGAIRTQELLAARRIDGAEQFFTSAVDFGYSKTAEETLQKWDRERVTGDIVRIIREFQPDVVILRWTGTPADGHGQHQASGIIGGKPLRGRRTDRYTRTGS